MLCWLCATKGCCSIVNLNRFDRYLNQKAYAQSMWTDFTPWTLCQQAWKCLSICKASSRSKYILKYLLNHLLSAVWIINNSLEKIVLSVELNADPPVLCSASQTSCLHAMVTAACQSVHHHMQQVVPPFHVNLPLLRVLELIFAGLMAISIQQPLWCLPTEDVVLPRNVWPTSISVREELPFWACTSFCFNYLAQIIAINCCFCWLGVPLLIITNACLRHFSSSLILYDTFLSDLNGCSSEIPPHVTCFRQRLVPAPCVDHDYWCSKYCARATQAFGREHLYGSCFESVGQQRGTLFFHVLIPPHIKAYCLLNQCP